MFALLTALSRKVNGALKPRTFLGCACLASIMHGVLTLLAKQLAGMGRDAGVPDLSRQLTAGKLADMLESYGPAGRRLYGVMEVLDFAYMFGWASVAAFAVTAGLAVVKAPKSSRTLNLLPLAMLAVDMWENIGILALLATYPRHTHSLAPLVAAAVRFKWQMATVLLGLLLVIAACWTVQAAKRALLLKPSRSRVRAGDGADDAVPGGVKHTQTAGGSGIKDA